MLQNYSHRRPHPFSLTHADDRATRAGMQGTPWSLAPRASPFAPVTEMQRAAPLRRCRVQQRLDGVPPLLALQLSAMHGNQLGCGSGCAGRIGNRSWACAKTCNAAAVQARRGSLRKPRRAAWLATTSYAVRGEGGGCLDCCVELSRKCAGSAVRHHSSPASAITQVTCQSLQCFCTTQICSAVSK